MNLTKNKDGVWERDDYYLIRHKRHWQIWRRNNPAGGIFGIYSTHISDAMTIAMANDAIGMMERDRR